MHSGSGLANAASPCPAWCNWPHDTSSRLVKEVASFGGDVRNLVPDFVLERFVSRFDRKTRG